MSGILSSLAFTTPWLLWALVVLPLIWFLLRVVPPTPVLRRFPGIVLLLGLADADSAAERTPPWLLALRVASLVAVIIGLAGPVLNPERNQTGTGPLLVLADTSWADASDWQLKRDRLMRAVADAERDGRPVAFVSLTATGATEIDFGNGGDFADKVAALKPDPWEPSEARMLALSRSLPDGGFDTLWISDGIDRPGRGALAAAVAAHGSLSVYQSARGAAALRPAKMKDGKIASTLVRLKTGAAQDFVVVAQGLDPTGVERELARQTLRLASSEQTKDFSFDLPPELRNRVTRLTVPAENSAGSVALADDALKRRKVALIEGGAAREGLELLSPGHYLREALRLNADLIEGTLADVLPAAPQVVILADVGRLSSSDTDALSDWVDQGGLLVRFAGPRLAASVTVDGAPDPLLPVTLRPGGRSFGGTMSWGEPRALAPFPEGSPFQGLKIPSEVTVKAQVLAEPGPDLADHTIAALADGTPLVTRTRMGEGQIVLFHVTANAEWSGLPLSGLFVDMLDRLSISSRPDDAADTDMAGTVWAPRKFLNAYGLLSTADNAAGVPGEKLAAGTASAEMPPGLYQSDDRVRALNVMTKDRTLTEATWPATTRIEGYQTAQERDLGGWLLATALTLMIADLLATLVLSGRFRRPGTATLGLMAAVCLLSIGQPRVAFAQSDLPADPELLAQISGGMVLAYVETGNRDVDETSMAGLRGLSMTMTLRTSVEPGDPVAVNLETDDLSMFPFLYWPITTDMPAPSPGAYQKLNRFLHTGGLILFDTRDADLSGGTATTPEGRRLQELAAPLDIPPLEPLPPDHVLTRSFYLLQDFPGRYTESPVWVEAAPQDAEQADGMPFRNLNDGVTPVVIGGNDWAAAWAVNDLGEPVFRVGSGLSGERQREIAYRFGVNLVMHVLTGNYKSDQVHVPALLERLGQ